MRAVELLKRDLPLAEIAISCGFYDQSHFSRAFKRRFGLSPARFRSSLIHV
jgi:AraC-like DNA-binding protein